MASGKAQMASAMLEISMLGSLKMKTLYFILAMMLATLPMEEVVVVQEVIVAAALNGDQGVPPELVAVLLLAAVLCRP
jgi:hypothetical protein